MFHQQLSYTVALKSDTGRMARFPLKERSLSNTSSHTAATYTSCETLVSTREATNRRHRSSATSSSKGKNTHTLSRGNSDIDQIKASSNTIIEDLECSLSRIEIEGINDFLFDESTVTSNARGSFADWCDDGDGCEDDEISELSSVSSYSVADSLCAGYLRNHGIRRSPKMTASASKADFLLDNEFEDDFATFQNIVSLSAQE